MRLIIHLNWSNRTKFNKRWNSNRFFSRLKNQNQKEELKIIKNPWKIKIAQWTEFKWIENSVFIVFIPIKYTMQNSNQTLHFSIIYFSEFYRLYLEMWIVIAYVNKMHEKKVYSNIIIYKLDTLLCIIVLSAHTHTLTLTQRHFKIPILML